MRVYSDELYKNVTAAAAEGYQDVMLRRTEMLRTQKARPQSMPAQSRRQKADQSARSQSRNSDRQAQIRKVRLQKNWDEAEKQTQERLRHIRDKTARRKEVKEKKFQKMLEDLDSEQAFKAQTSEYLLLKEQAEKRTKKSLHREWCKNVYNPLQRDIQTKLDAMQTSDIERIRRHDFQEYVDNVNNKEGVFRDIIIESDYNPLKNRSKYTKYSRAKYDAVDPLHRDITQSENEARLVKEIDPNATQIQPKPRESLDLLLWDKLDCTPYARYANKETEVRHIKAVPGQKSRNHSDVELDHYTIPKDPALMKRQYFPGGKLIPPEKRRPDNLLYHYEDSYPFKMKFEKLG